MKIEKRKVFQSRPLPQATKSAIAAALGLAASFTLNACDDNSSPSSGQVVEPIDNSSSSEEKIEPLGGLVAPDEYRAPPESSSEAASPESSGEKVGPKTSSETVTAASSSSQTVDIPLSHEPVSSSLMEAISSALESSSSAAEPTSSETVPASSASQPTEQELKDACQGSPGGTSVDIGGKMYLCPDTGGGMMFSMISTFERTDIEA